MFAQRRVRPQLLLLPARGPLSQLVRARGPCRCTPSAAWASHGASRAASPSLFSPLPDAARPAGLCRAAHGPLRGRGRGPISSRWAVGPTHGAAEHRRWWASSCSSYVSWPPFPAGRPGTDAVAKIKLHPWASVHAVTSGCWPGLAVRAGAACRDCGRSCPPLSSRRGKLACRALAPSKDPREPPPPSPLWCNHHGPFSLAPRRVVGLCTPCIRPSTCVPRFHSRGGLRENHGAQDVCVLSR